MQLYIYSIYDVKTGTFATPFFQQNDKVAIRSFERVVMDKNSTVHSHCADYQLFRLGTFKDELPTPDSKESSLLITSEPLNMIKSGADYLEYTKNQTQFPFHQQ